MFDRKTSFFTGITLVLVLIILLQRACTPKCPEVSISEVSVHVDTLYREIIKHDVKKVVVYSTDTEFVKEPWMVPDTNYATLKKQFEDLVVRYASSRVYKDTIRIDSIGSIVLTDTVSKNLLGLRTYEHNYKIPTVVITRNVPMPPRRQLYVGGAIGVTYPVSISTVQAGLMFKNKKDQLFGVHAGIDTRGIMTYSLSTYWKISFKR